eukprot:5861639-Pyramimonas_sp.AAC.1
MLWVDGFCAWLSAPLGSFALVRSSWPASGSDPCSPMVRCPVRGSLFGGQYGSAPASSQQSLHCVSEM